MVNDEMLKKLKDQYIGVEVPDDEKNKLNEILEYAKIDRKRKRKKVIITTNNNAATEIIHLAIITFFLFLFLSILAYSKTSFNFILLFILQNPFYLVMFIFYWLNYIIYNSKSNYLPFLFCK